MTNQELERLLSQKEDAPARENIALVLSPDITRNAMRLKKLRRDRRQALLCVLAGIVFLLAAGGIMYLLKTSENPETLMKPIMTGAAGCMILTLLLAPALAWFAEEERKNEA